MREESCTSTFVAAKTLLRYLSFRENFANGSVHQIVERGGDLLVKGFLRVMFGGLADNMGIRYGAKCLKVDPPVERESRGNRLELSQKSLRQNG